MSAPLALTSLQQWSGRSSASPERRPRRWCSIPRISKRLERGLKAADGKVLVNSVSGEEKSLARVLPLVKKYGAAVIGLALDEKGIPETAEERLAVAARILERTRSLGIPDET